MKLPFDLGVKLFFRLLLPGFLLTLGVLPVLFTLLDVLAYKDRDVPFVLATILMGWLILAADMPVYMLLEGRRYWPQSLWTRSVEREQTRLDKLNRQITEYLTRKEKKDPESITCDAAIPEKVLERRYLEASVGKRSFPLDPDGERYAAFPTRLGNALASFETYADSRYGIDDVFYWPRIWVNLSKDIRDELDNQQAMADSTVYSSFALAVTALLWALYGVLDLAEVPVASWLYGNKIVNGPLGAGIFAHLPGAGACFLLSVLALMLSFSAYRISVFANEQFGNLFMAVIDTNVSKLKEWVDVDGLEKKIAARTNVHVDEEEKFEVVRRYLQYFNVKLPGFPRSVPFPQVKGKIQTARKV